MTYIPTNSPILRLANYNGKNTYIEVKCMRAALSQNGRPVKGYSVDVLITLKPSANRPTKLDQLLELATELEDTFLHMDDAIQAFDVAYHDIRALVPLIYGEQAWKLRKELFAINHVLEEAEEHCHCGCGCTDPLDNNTSSLCQACRLYGCCKD